MVRVGMGRDMRVWWANLNGAGGVGVDGVRMVGGLNFVRRPRNGIWS